MLPFSQCEEAFLLRNVQNVIDVWARGSGLAKLNFCARNGQAELQLFYQLGHPEASHLPHQPPPQPSYSSSPPNYPPRPARHKSLRRILKNRKRAADFQARKRAEASSAAASSSHHTSNTSRAASSSSLTCNTTSSQAVTSPMMSLSTNCQPIFTMTSTICSTTQVAISPSSSSPIIQHAVFTPASCITTPSLSPIPISSVSFQAVTSSPVERYTLETMPLPQYPECPVCYRNFDFPCYATPCLVCGLWFHNDCYGGHHCSVSDDDDDYDSETDNEIMDISNTVAFPDIAKQKVFTAP